jgi:oligopeptide/dipeptide ABC transporter ATP-binding protein
MQNNGTSVLAVDGLSIAVGATPLVADVSLRVERGQITAMIGESGSGKSITASAMLGLLNPGIYRVTARSLEIDGSNLSSFSESDFTMVRGQRVGYVMQDPGTALDPTMPIGDQIAEIFVIHRGMDWQRAQAEAVRMLDLVRIPAASRRALDYPQAFSGGMKQRVVIAGAVALSPALLIADEPTTALDVTVQAEILSLVDELRRTIGMGVLLITHDLGIVYQVADQVVVMYAGRVVEDGRADRICTRPAHPYAAGLLASVPDLDGLRGAVAAIPGTPPVMGVTIAGCAFADRCAWRQAPCRDGVPLLAPVDSGHRARCLYPLSEHADV